MRKIYKKNLLKIGNSMGVYLPMKMVKSLSMDKGHVKVYKQGTKIIIEKLLLLNNNIDEIYVGKIGISGHSYRINLPKFMVDKLTTDKFKVYKQNNKIIVRNN